MEKKVQSLLLNMTTSSNDCSRTPGCWRFLILTGYSIILSTACLVSSVLWEPAVCTAHDWMHCFDAMSIVGKWRKQGSEKKNILKLFLSKIQFGKHNSTETTLRNTYDGNVFQRSNFSYFLFLLQALLIPLCKSNGVGSSEGLSTDAKCRCCNVLASHQFQYVTKMVKIKASGCQQRPSNLLMWKTSKPWHEFEITGVNHDVIMNDFLNALWVISLSTDKRQ